MSKENRRLEEQVLQLKELNLLGKTIKFTGLGLGAKEFSDYVKKMKDEGKNPYSFTNFKKEYGDPLAEKVKNAYGS